MMIRRDIIGKSEKNCFDTTYYYTNQWYDYRAESQTEIPEEDIWRLNLSSLKKSMEAKLVSLSMTDNPKKQ